MIAAALVPGGVARASAWSEMLGTYVGHGPAIPAGSVTASGDAGVLAPLLILGSLLALLGLGSAAALVARARGWDPDWAASVGHSWREAQYRAVGAWLDLVDRTPRSRPRPASHAPTKAPPAKPHSPGKPPADPQPAGPPRPPIAAPHTRLALALVVLVGVGVALGLAFRSGPAATLGNSTQESIFQDDDHLLYTTSTTVDHTLAVLRGLGVDRVRVTVKWSVVAPDPQLRTRPTFDASDPAAYPATGWVDYDRVVRLARAHGIGVVFDATAPGPLWAMRRASGRGAADHYAPSAREFGLFVTALGSRYSGSYTPDQQEQSVEAAAGGFANGGPLPRVEYWSIWNEPNQPGWLAPQWRAAHGRELADAPRLYRQYVDEALGALSATGHSSKTDTILIGDLAPSGTHAAGWYRPMTPMPFVRALYCVDANLEPLSGSAARGLGCPARPDRRAFVAHNAGLFDVTGFSHHPFDLFHRPDYRPRDPDVVTLSTLSRLTDTLDRIFNAYGVRRQLPLYLTEYGYQTNPPDPYQIVTPTQQASYLDQAAYIAWQNPRVRSSAQFLLYDSRPDSRYPPSNLKYWHTFQTGLLFASGVRKPAFAAYRLPIWLPSTRPDSSGRLLVWGQLRSSTRQATRQARIEWRGRNSSYRAIATTTARGIEGYLVISVHVPGSGPVRISWQTPDGHVVRSRAVATG